LAIRQQSTTPLTFHEERLQKQIDVPTLADLISALVGETTRMRTSAQVLHEEMGATTAEVGRLREQLEKAQGQALVDALTELHNRRAFEQALAQMLTEAADSASPCSLLMAEIDHFKRVNDTYGHVFGDKVIRYVAQRISLSIKGPRRRGRLWRRGIRDPASGDDGAGGAGARRADSHVGRAG
jgi:diguanylate cyclase